MTKEESAKRELLYNISKAISSELNLDSLLRKVSALLRKSFRFDYGAVFLIEEGKLVLKAIFNSRLDRRGSPKSAKLVEEKIASLRLSVGRGITGVVAETGKPILLTDVSRDKRYLGVHEDAKSEVCVPLRSGSGLIGVVNLESKRAGAFSREDLDLLVAVAGEISVAFENAKLYQRQKRSVEELTALLDTSQAITSTLDVNSVLNVIVTKAKEVCRADSTTVYLLEKDSLKPIVALRTYAEDAQVSTVKVGEGIAGLVASTGVGEMVQNGEAILAVPINLKRKVIGVIALARREGKDPFHQEDLQFLTTLSGYASSAIETGRLFDESRKKLSQISALYEASKSLTTSLEIDTILNAVVREAMKLMKTQTASIMLFNERGELKFRTFQGLSPDQVEDYERRPLKKTDELALRVIEWKAPILADDLDEIPGLRGTLVRKDTKSFYSFPLISKERVIGVLNVSSPRPYKISQAEVEVFTSLANQAAVAIENAELYNRTKRRVKEVSIIRDVTLAIGSILDPKELLSRVSSMIRDALGYLHVAILLVDQESRELHVETAHGYGDLSRLRIKIGEQGITGWVAKEGKPLLVSDVTQDPRYLKLNEEVRCEICVPLKKGDKVIGVLDIAANQIAGLGQDDLNLLEELGSQISIYLENARLYQQLSGSYDEVDRLRTFSQSVLQNIPSGIVTTDTSGKITLVNKAAEELLGFEARELLDSSVDDIFTSPGASESPLMTTLREGQGVARREIEVNTKGGRLIPVGFSTSLLANEKGETTGAIGILRDLTETKEMERRLMRADRLAALGEMVAGVAHEVKNPLAGIRTGIEYLSKDLPPKLPQKETVELILTEVSRLDRIVKDMTSFAYRPPLELAPVDVGELIEFSLRLLEREIEEGGVTVNRELNPQLPSIVGDGSQLGEVFINLLLNALQAMKGGGELTVRTDYVPEEEWIEIQIQDTGSGIAREDLGKVFNPFFTTKRGGTGLGLSIVNRIIEDHNGTITAESVSGQGSTFRIKLPAKRV